MRPKLPRTVVVLGLISLLTDAASETALALLPALLASFGAGALALGSIEGIAEAVASVLKLVAGRAADRLGKNRPFVVAGYSLSSAVRPFFALATAPWHVLAIRVADRVGKGLRSSPRDALLAASVDPAHRGAAFGWHRAMDNAGAVVGPLCAAAYLYYSNDLRRLFWLTAIPGAAVILVAVFGVGEQRAPKQSAAPAAPSEPAETTDASSAETREDRRREHAALIRVLVPIGLFSLGNASDTFLLLRAGAVSSSLMALPLLWVGLHIVKTTTSFYGGRLADRWGRRKTIVLGWAIYAVIYLAFAFARTAVEVAALFVVYGLYHGLSEGSEKALIADVVPAARRGAGFGWYYLSQGLLLLCANLLFGAAWTWLGARTAFIGSAAIACVASLAFLALAQNTTSPRS